VLDGLGRTDHFQVKNPVVFDFCHVLVDLADDPFDALTPPAKGGLFEQLKDLLQALDLSLCPLPMLLQRVLQLPRAGLSPWPEALQELFFRIVAVFPHSTCP
jgi:hypothetical protein